MDNFLFSIKKIVPRPLLQFFRPAYHFLLSLWAALFYGFPSRRLCVIGVTGTKGKTTVVELLHFILEEAGHTVASISSRRFRIGDEEVLNPRKMTMPGRMQVHKFLHEASRRGCSYAILEVTSEGILQSRHRFIRFDAAVMTNIFPEHIEAHGNFEKYLRAKLDLFWRLPKNGIAIMNGDDPQARRFAAASPAHKIFYGRDGIRDGQNRAPIHNITVGADGIRFILGGDSFFSPMIGEWSVGNILAAVTAALSQHIPQKIIRLALSRFTGVPGRMEYVQKEPFQVVVDYAHTPDSLKKVYTFLRESGAGHDAENAALICVLGAAGGGRDKWKRREFAKIAEQFCGVILLTNEDPYDEKPETIIEEIASGFSHALNSTINIQKIVDRREAIRAALKCARFGDTVVVTGKGSERWIMGPGNTRIAWSDADVVKEELNKLSS